MSKCVEFQREIEASEVRESKKLPREHIFGAPCAVPSMTKDTPRPRNVRTPGLKRGFYRLPARKNGHQVKEWELGGANFSRAGSGCEVCMPSAFRVKVIFSMLFSYPAE